MKIRFDPARKLSPGNFNAVVENGILVLPEVMKMVMDHYPYAHRSAEKFAASFIQFPDWHVQLGWQKQEYAQAVDDLIAVLRGHVDESCLDKNPSKMKRAGGFGANVPKLKDPSDTEK